MARSADKIKLSTLLPSSRSFSPPRAVHRAVTAPLRSASLPLHVPCYAAGNTGSEHLLTSRAHITASHTSSRRFSLPGSAFSSLNFSPLEALCWVTTGALWCGCRSSWRWLQPLELCRTFRNLLEPQQVHKGADCSRGCCCHIGPPQFHSTYLGSVALVMNLGFVVQKK